MIPPRWYLATASAPLCTSAPYMAWLAATSDADAVVAVEPYTYDTNICPTFCSSVIVAGTGAGAGAAVAEVAGATVTASARTESTTRIRRMTAIPSLSIDTVKSREWQDGPYVDPSPGPRADRRPVRLHRAERHPGRRRPHRPARPRHVRRGPRRGGVVHRGRRGEHHQRARRVAGDRRGRAATP